MGFLTMMLLQLYYRVSWTAKKIDNRSEFGERWFRCIVASCWLIPRPSSRMFCATLSSRVTLPSTRLNTQASTRTTDVYGPCSRAPVHITREHGPSIRPVNTGSVYRPVLSTTCLKRAIIFLVIEHIFCKMATRFVGDLAAPVAYIFRFLSSILFAYSC